MFKHVRKCHTFEGFEGSQEGQVEAKMGRRWAKMASGSELDVIFGQMRAKMEAKFDLEAVLRRS